MEDQHRSLFWNMIGSVMIRIWVRQILPHRKAARSPSNLSEAKKYFREDRAYLVLHQKYPFTINYEAP